MDSMRVPQVPLLERNRRRGERRVALNRARLERRRARRGCGRRAGRTRRQRSKLGARLRAARERRRRRGVDRLVFVPRVDSLGKRRSGAQTVRGARRVHRQEETLRERIPARRHAQEHLGRIHERDDGGQRQLAAGFFTLLLLVHGALDGCEPREGHAVNRTARAAEHPVAARRVPHDRHERCELVLRRRDGGLRPSKRRLAARELDSVDGQQRLERSVVVVRGDGREGQHGPAVARGCLVRGRLVLFAERGPRRGRFLRQDEHVQRGGDAPLVRRPLIPLIRDHPLMRHRQERAAALARGEGRRSERARHRAATDHAAVAVAVHRVGAER